MLHPKNPIAVVFFRNAYVYKNEWLHCTRKVSHCNDYSQKALFLEISANEGLCIVTQLEDISFHSNVVSQASQFLSSFQDKFNYINSTQKKDHLTEMKKRNEKQKRNKYYVRCKT